MNDKIRHTVLPLLAALIWGMAFSAQSVCAAYIGPFTLNAVRGLIAFVLLLAVCLARKNWTMGAWKDLLLGGLCCGVALFLASNVQQLGISGTSAGKAGFITALYIVIVPVAGIFFRKKVAGRVWAAVVIAVAGMYCLCITEQFTIAASDLYVLICAFLFAAQIMAVDYFVQKVDGIALSCAQFLVVAVLSSAGMAAAETPAWADLAACIWPLLYVAVLSSCVAYTLQIVAQKGANPTVVSLLLSLESVFAAIGGAVLLHERLTGRELLGCVLMMAAIVLAELPERKAVQH